MWYKFMLIVVMVTVLLSQGLSIAGVSPFSDDFVELSRVLNRTYFGPKGQDWSQMLKKEPATVAIVLGHALQNSFLLR